MKFASVRLVTLDVERLIAFYAQLPGFVGVGRTDAYAKSRLPNTTLAISAQQLIQRFNAGAAPAAANLSAILEFEVDDVDRVSSLLGSAAVIVQEPTLMPWGNRSLLLRDPDGSLVNIFSRLRAFELPRLP